MKKLITLTLLVAILASCNNSNKYKISGEIKNGNDRWLYLERLDINEIKTIDSTKLNEDGSFSFKGERIIDPTFFYLKLSDNNYITLLVDSTETPVINADAKNLEETYSIERSLGSGYIKILNRKMRITQSKTDSILALYEKVSSNDWMRKRELEDQYLSTIETHKKFVGNFVMENPRSFASYYAMFLELNKAPIMNVTDKKDNIFFSTLATSLNLIYPNSERVKQLYSYVERANKLMRRNKSMNLLVEKASSSVPDIEGTTTDGRNIKLSSLSGKTVLLTFWASYNQFSRRENKNLKNIYAKYKNKGFDIYQFSFDHSNILWESAIDQDQINWLSVSDMKGVNSSVAQIYNINALPANFLIAPNGQIIGKDLYGARLDEKLSGLLK